jgi:hypothetical protein
MSTKTLANYESKRIKRIERCNICYNDFPIDLMKNYCHKCKKKIYNCHERHFFQICLNCVK